MTPPRDATREPREDEHAVYELTLFVCGVSEFSVRAIANARRVCDLHLHGRYRLTVVNVREDPAAAFNSQVIAAPTLVKNLPLPVRRLVGDLSDAAKFQRTFDLPIAEAASRSSG